MYRRGLDSRYDIRSPLVGCSLLEGRTWSGTKQNNREVNELMDILS